MSDLTRSIPVGVITRRRTRFIRQSARPVSPETYRALARRLRRDADALDARASAATPEDKRALTRVVHGLAYAVRALREKHDRLEKQQQLERASPSVATPNLYNSEGREDE